MCRLGTCLGRTRRKEEREGERRGNGPQGAVDNARNWDEASKWHQGPVDGSPPLFRGGPVLYFSAVCLCVS